MKSTYGGEYTKGKGYPTLSIRGIPVVTTASVVPMTMVVVVIMVVNMLIIIIRIRTVTMIMIAMKIMLMVLDNADDKTYVSNDGN